MTDTATAPAPRLTAAAELLRMLGHLVAVVVVAVWGFATWPAPLSVVVGVGAPLLIVLLWALVLSPSPVLRAELYVMSLVEIAVTLTAAYAFWSLGLPVVAGVYLVATVALGVLHGLGRLGR